MRQRQALDSGQGLFGVGSKGNCVGVAYLPDVDQRNFGQRLAFRVLQPLLRRAMHPADDSLLAHCVFESLCVPLLDRVLYRVTSWPNVQQPQRSVVEVRVRAGHVHIATIFRLEDHGKRTGYRGRPAPGRDGR